MLGHEWTTSVQLSASSVTLNKRGMYPSVSALETDCIHGNYMHTHYHTGAHTHTQSSGSPNYPLETAGTHEAPDQYRELTHSASCPQRNKGDFMSLFKSLGFGYISARPYMDLLRPDLSSITEEPGPDLALGLLRAAACIPHVGNGDRMAK